MILPDNGKVVIIDDKIEDVIELISGLSSEKIPFVYYKDELGEDLPNEPLNNVRIVFLDLLLIDDNKPAVKNVVSTLISRIKRIIPKNNGPYILIYFSSTKKIYGKAFERELNKKALKNYKPILSLSISKPTNLEKVKLELRSKFDKFKSFKAFLLLESITNKATSNAVNYFTSIIPSDDTNFDKKLKDILYQTGEARVGKENFTELSNGKKIKNSLLTLSSTIAENFDTAINELDFDEIAFEQVTKKDTSEEAKSKVNSRLHIFQNTNSPIKSGTVFKITKNKSLLNSILDTFNEKHSIDDNAKPQLLLIDITPVCDYSQDKNYSRGVYALLLETDKYKNKNGEKSQSFFGFSPLLHLNNKTQRIIIDYRHITSFSKAEFEKLKLKPWFKLGSEITIEFQSDTSKHINRPGIISV
jgi:hypothetical protein